MVNIMTNSIEYKEEDKELIIPFLVVKQYIEGLLDAYHTLMAEEECHSGTNKALMNLIEKGDFCDKKLLQSLLINSNGDYTKESDFCSIDPQKLQKDLTNSLNERIELCSSHIKKFQYNYDNNGSDFIEFRIFDGSFYPYFETFIYPQELDNQIVHNHFMKSGIGTAFLGEVNKESLNKPITNTRTFTIHPLTGNSKIKAFNKIFSKLPEMILDAFDNKKDLVIKISKALLDEIKVWSYESQREIDPIKSLFLLSKKLEAMPNPFKESSKNAEPNKKDSISKVVNIVYKLDIEEYRCGSAAFKTYADVKKKTKPVPIKLDEEDTYKLLEYVSSSKVNYKVNGTPTTTINLPVLVTKSVADTILSNLNLSNEEFSSNDKLLIEIDKNILPSMGELFHHVIEDVVKNVLFVESSITSTQRAELESQCAISFNIAGMSAESIIDKEL